MSHDLDYTSKEKRTVFLVQNVCMRPSELNCHFSLRCCASMFKMLKFLCLTIFLIGTFADEELYQKTNSTFDERIIGGADAAIGQFPHHVSLRINNGAQHFCGGAIIGPRFILTAAHCTQADRSDPKNVQVIVGGHRRTSGGTLHALDKIINHPKFDGSRGANDVSMLRTAKDIVFTKLVQPIALPTDDLPAEEGLALFLSGWGRNKVSFHVPPSSPSSLSCGR